MGSKQSDGSKAAQIQADATKYASDKDYAAREAALEEQKRAFDLQQKYLQEQEDYNRGLTVQNQQNYQPFVDMGHQQLNQLLAAQNDPNSWLNKQYTGEDLQNDAGYNFRLNQGNAALNASAAAKGGLLGGGQLKALEEYNQNFASQEFDNAYARHTQEINNRYGREMNMLGLGMQGIGGYAGASVQSQLGTQMANLTGQNANTVNGINMNSAATQNNLALNLARQQAQYAMQSRSSPVANAIGGAMSGVSLASGLGTALGTSGIVSGATAGSIGGPVGMGIGALIGGLASIL